MLNAVATFVAQTWKVLAALAVVLGVVTGISAFLGWLPSPAPDLSLAVYEVDNQGRRTVSSNTAIEGDFDLSGFPETYLTAPLRLAIRSNRPQELENVRVRVLYPPNITISSTANSRQLRTGEIAYEQAIGVIGRDDQYAYLPLVDTLRVANLMHATDVIAVTNDNVPTYLRVLTWLPYSEQELREQSPSNPTLRGATRREIPITVIVSSDDRPDVRANLMLTFELGLQLLYPPPNTESEISHDLDSVQLTDYLDFRCETHGAWSAVSPYTGGTVSYRECNHIRGGDVQVISYNGLDKRWVFDTNSDDRVEFELLDTNGDGAPDARVAYSPPMERVRWDERALGGQ